MLILGVVLILAFLGWGISRIPLQIFLLLLLIVSILVVSIIVFLISRIKQAKSTPDIVQVRRSSVRARTATPSQPDPYYKYAEDERRHREKMRSLKTMGDVRSLSPPEFEEFCGKLLESLGYTNVAVTGKSNDMGADVMATAPNGDFTIVQCKQYGVGKKITSPDFQKFLGSMGYFHEKRNAKRGIYITTSSFTQTVYEIANESTSYQFTLIDGERLASLIEQTQAMW